MAFCLQGTGIQGEERRPTSPPTYGLPHDGTGLGASQLNHSVRHITIQQPGYVSKVMARIWPHMGHRGLYGLFYDCNRCGRIS